MQDWEGHVAYVLLMADGAGAAGSKRGSLYHLHADCGLTAPQRKYCVYLGAGVPSWPNVGPGWGALGLISPSEERPPYRFNAGGLKLKGSVGKGAPRTDRCPPWPVTQYVRGSPFARITRARRDASFRCY